ncbi:unnamed protein product [Mytilus edulis]|uniref:Uncharacterized protein n=1 Tax=Mytilus edulis TaxID=6550 RepID=A0A8S3QMH8_MYTED|nr:unnamed protein product [Mytilus edulis]
MEEKMKKDRDRVEIMAPTKQAVHKQTIERIGLRSQKSEIEYDTVEYVDRTGNELLANWKCIVQEKEEAIQTTSNKLQNMQPSKLSENRLRQEIEQYIDFIEADRHVMKRCMQNLQISMKDRLDYLRKQKQFFLEKQKTLNNVYKTTEKSKRSRIPNPFPQFILDVKHEHYQLFNEELLISSNGSTNKYKRQMTEDNAVIIDDTTLYIGRTGKTRVMTPIHENILESDKCITGECVDSCCTLRRSDSEISFLNHEFEVEYNMFELSLESKETENCSRKEETHRNELQIHVKKSKIPVAVILPQLLANKKMKYEEKSPFTPAKPSLLLPNKKIKCVEDSYSETLKLQPLVPNTKIIFAKEPSDTTLKLPLLLPFKEQICMQEHLYTNRPDSPKLLPPLQNLPQNIKKTLIVNKIRDEGKDKSKVMPIESMSKPTPQQPAEKKASNEILDMTPKLVSKTVKLKTKYQTFKLKKASRKNNYASDRKYRFSRLHISSAPQKIAETTANGGTFDVNSELALEREDWENMFPTFRLQKASEKDCFISERTYRFSRLDKSSGKNCYIPKSKSDKVSKIVTGKYCTTKTQKMNAKKQTEIEKSDSYPAPDQSHTRQQNFKKILIVKKIRNENKDKSEVVKSMPLSAPKQADETNTFNKMSKSAQQQVDETTAFNEMSRSAQQQADKTLDSDKMSKSTQQQFYETTDSIKILNSTRKPNRNVRKQTVKEKSASYLESYLEPDQTHYMPDIAVDDKYPTEDIFLKLDDNELIGFYQVQVKDLFPVIENVSDIKRIELFKKLQDQRIAVIQSNTVDDIQSSSSGSTLNCYQDAGENGGTLKSTMKSFVKKLIPDCITNGNQCQPTETLSPNWQIIKIRPGTNIKTQHIPMPPNSPKPKIPNFRR